MLPARPFQSCHKLEALHLNGAGLSSIDPQAFKGLRNLQYLNLRNNDLTDDSLSNVTVNSADMWKLDLGLNRLTSVPSLVAQSTNLKELFMDQNYLSYDSLHCLSINANLKILDLSYNAITHIPNLFITNHPNIHTILMQGNPFVCDCSFHVPGKLFNVSNITIFHYNDHICSYPASVKGQNIFTFIPSRWDCKLETIVISSVCVALTLLICVVIGVVWKSGCHRPHCEIPVKNCCSGNPFKLIYNGVTTENNDQDSCL